MNQPLGVKHADVPALYPQRAVEPRTGHARRASPLLLHCHYLSDEAEGSQYLAVHTLLKARFLPDAAKINVGRTPCPVNVDWKDIENYLIKKFQHAERIHG